MIFPAGEKIMLLLRSRIPRLVLFFLSVVFLTPLSPVTPNSPPSQATQTPVSLSFEQQNQLRDLAARVLQHADKAGCKQGVCTILVANFTDSSGSTSVLGMQLADAVSEQLAAGAMDIRVADRKRFYEFLETERIPSKFLAEENAERWLAIEQSANAVLVGHLGGNGDKLTLAVQLIDAHFLTGNPRDHREVRKGPQEKVQMTLMGTDEQFRKPAEPFREAPASQAAEDQGALRAGQNGVTVPIGYYAPTPEYTDFARTTKIQGAIILMATVSEAGGAENLKIVKGLPYGLNQASLDAVRKWKFHPATLDGKPVPVQVPIEVTFRLF
jgi:TonB family protein